MFLAIGWLGLVAGCASDGSAGYTTASLYREDIATVAVPIWHRGAEVYRRNLEDRLTEAIVKRIELDTPYKVTDTSKADTLLEGRIVSVSQRQLGIDPDTGRPRDLELQLSVDFTWTDLRTGEILAEERNFRASAVYYPTGALDEDFFEGSTDAINRLALRIVERMEKPW